MSEREDAEPEPPAPAGGAPPDGALPGGALPDGALPDGGPTDGALSDVRVLPVGRSGAVLLFGALLESLGAQVRAAVAPGGQAGPALRAALEQEAGTGATAVVVVAADERDLRLARARFAGERAALALVWCVIEEPPPAGDSGRPDPRRTDAGRPDAGPADAGRADAGPADAGSADSGPADADARVAAALDLDSLSGLPARPEPLPVGTVYGAALAAVYACAGLLAAERTGRPVFVRVPMVAAAATVLSRKLIRADDPAIVEYATQPHLPISEIYECRDGGFVQSHGLYASFAEILLTEAGHPEWIDAALPGLLAFSSRDEEQLWRERLAGIFLRRDARDWERVINERGGACTRVRTPEEWLREPHRVAAALPPEPGAPGIRAVSVRPNRAGHASAPPPRLRDRDVADAGAANRDPADRDTADGGTADGGTADGGTADGGTADRGTAGGDTAGGGLPLSGIRVVDFCIVLAGPTCGRLLADLGADVIKIDDPARPCPPLQWLDINRGKRSLLLDLRAAGGAEIARDLIAGAEVVLENYRAGRLAVLGLGYPQLSQERPDLVYASMNAFDFGGAWEPRAGWEHNAQAASGMQAARSRSGVPQQVPVPVNDYVTGLYAAFGVIAALRHRARTGRGALVRGSLARSASVTMQLRRPGPGALLTPDRRINSPAFRQRMLDQGILRRWRHPRLGWLEQVAPRPVTEPALDRAGWPAPQPGADAAAILELTGRGDAERDRLVAKGVVHPERSLALAPPAAGAGPDAGP